MTKDGFQFIPFAIVAIAGIFYLWLSLKLLFELSQKTTSDRVQLRDSASAVTGIIFGLVMSTMFLFVGIKMLLPTWTSDSILQKGLILYVVIYVIDYAYARRKRLEI